MLLLASETQRAECLREPENILLEWEAGILRKNAGRHLASVRGTFLPNLTRKLNFEIDLLRFFAQFNER